MTQLWPYLFHDIKPKVALDNSTAAADKEPALGTNAVNHSEQSDTLQPLPARSSPVSGDVLMIFMGRFQLVQLHSL